MTLARLVFFVLLFVLDIVAFAQNAPQVVTMKNGTQFIGQIATVSAFSAEQPLPWNSQQIAMVDDGLRRIFFNKNPDKIGNITPLNNDHPLANPTEFEIVQRTHNGNSRGYGNLLVLPFNEYGHRIVNVASPEGNYTFSQGITKINPHWCEVKTLADTKGSKLRDWTMRLDTNSIPPAVLRNLLLGKIRDRNNPADYLSIVDFFNESQQYKLALDELAFVRQKFPDMKETIEEQISIIRQARARKWVRQINNRIDAGQPMMAKTMLRAFDRSKIAGEILAEMANIQNQLNSRSKKIEQAIGPVLKLVEKLKENPASSNLELTQLPMLDRFREELQAQLNFENVSRLDAFKRFSQDSEMNDLQKLSLAISGWLLGTNNATDNFAVSQSFLDVRDLVVEYITIANKNRRIEILDALKNFEGSEPKYLAPLIARLLPPKAPDLKDHDPRIPLEFSFQINGAKSEKEKLNFKYHVQLPPEYDPFRKYPCIFALPGGRNIDRQIAFWAGPFNEKLGVRVGDAMKNGYIVVVIDWKTEGQQEYAYSAREHTTVLTAVRKSLEQFSIDTDRMFLAGHRFGADAAFDIGVSHPDHWAGVIGISGRVAKYPDLYREHIHNNLPLYCVIGEKDIVSKKSSEESWSRWLTSKKFFECTVVEYKGRSNEFFTEEVDDIFNWAAGQRRKRPDFNGFNFVGKLRRPWDNYFWFYEIHGFPAEKVVWPQFYGNKFPRPIKAEAILKGNQVNRFVIGPSNQGAGITIWLTPEYTDFNKPLLVTGRGEYKGFVSPSRHIMLEDVRLRSDRQHPFWANVHCEGKSWRPNISREQQATLEVSLAP